MKLVIIDRKAQKKCIVYGDPEGLTIDVEYLPRLLAYLVAHGFEFSIAEDDRGLITKGEGEIDS